MWVLDLLQDTNVVKLDVQVLIDGLKGAFNADVVLELDDHFLVDERLEEAIIGSANIQ